MDMNFNTEIISLSNIPTIPDEKIKIPARWKSKLHLVTFSSNPEAISAQH